MDRLFYQPETGVSADYIPFFENGTFYLFYLRDFRDAAACGEGTPWYLLTTTDFARFAEHGEALPRGAKEQQDLYVFTGSVTKLGGRYHIYYTGHNPHLRAQGKPEQAVMHAVSDDLLRWTKRPEDTFFSPAEGYEPHDWRDPFVWYDADAGRWQMLLAARKTVGPSRRRGITARCSSPDGLRWTVEKPYWEPGLYFTHECPDLFRMGDWYYLLFSEFSSEKVTRYRMSRSPYGPWTAPRDDRLDGCAYYAAKSAEGNGGRFLFGWLATREGDSDEGGWQWGGCLVVHELAQRPDGSLCVRLPKTVEARLPEGEARPVALDGRTGLESRQMGVMGACGSIVCDLRASGDTGELTVALAADEGLSEGYFLRLDRNRGRMAVDRWPRVAERGFEPGLERPLPAARDGAYRLRILVDGSAACAYLNDEIALCFRMYDRTRDRWGVLAEGLCADGSASAGWTR